VRRVTGGCDIPTSGRPAMIPCKHSQCRTFFMRLRRSFCDVIQAGISVLQLARSGLVWIADGRVPCTWESTPPPRTWFDWGYQHKRVKMSEPQQVHRSNSATSSACAIWSRFTHSCSAEMWSDDVVLLRTSSGRSADQTSAQFCQPWTPSRKRSLQPNNRQY
jgi:hypothetical protein